MCDKITFGQTFLCAFFFLSIYSSVTAHSNKSPIPLNFIEGIEKIKQKLDLAQLYSKSDFDFINKIPFSQDQFIVDTLENFALLHETSSIKLPNITTECGLQLVQWFESIKSSPPQLWAFSG